MYGKTRFRIGVAQLCCRHVGKFFFYFPICCNLSEDIKHSCLTVTINVMEEIHPVIYLLLAVQSQLTLVATYMRLVDHTQRRATVGRTPLDE